MHLALGWEVIKGFVVFELAETSTFVAHKRWWNARPSGTSTVWVDFTPRPEGVTDAVLVESLLSTKERALPTDALRTAAAARMELGGLVAPAAATERATTVRQPCCRDAPRCAVFGSRGMRHFTTRGATPRST